MLTAYSFTGKVIVWLIAIMVPVQSLPLLACDCGGSTSSVAKSADIRSTIAKCPGRFSRDRVAHPCCARRALAATACGCCGLETCCCHRGSNNPGGECHCSTKNSIPVPNPAPLDSRVDCGKLLLAADCQMATTAMPLVASFAHRAPQVPVSGQTALERLSTLCRLVV